MKFLNVQTHFIAFWFPDGCASRAPEYHKYATFFSQLQSEAAVTESYRKVWFLEYISLWFSKKEKFR